MIISDMIALHRTVQDLLGEQAALFHAPTVDFSRADMLSQEVSERLASLPTADALKCIDELVREQLLDAARRTAVALASSAAALSHYRQLQIDHSAQEERGGLAMRAYLPVTEQQPAHFLDERR